MPTLSVQKQLAHLVAHVHELLSRVRAEAPIEELRLRASDAVKALETVQKIIGESPTGAFDLTARHIRWLIYWYEKGKHHKYEGDVISLYVSDLPGVVAAVETWLEKQVDPRLLGAVQKSWEAQHYGNAVREAFICLEEALRTAAELDESRGLSGDKLVTAAFAGGNLVGKVSSDGFMGQLTTGEIKGLEYLMRGAFLLFRNATAHRNIAYSEGEAEGVINVVNHCLRFVPAE